MDTDQLISKIVDEGAQKPLPHPFRQVLFWLAGTAVWLGALSWHGGLRADITEKLADPFFIAEPGLLFGIAFTAALAALCLSRPDSCQMPWIKYVPFGFLAPWALAAYAGSTGDTAFSEICESATLGQFDCPLHIALFSVPPGIAIFMIARKGAPIHYYWAGAMATLSVTSFGYLCMRLVEQNDDPAHLIVWHALPVAVMCAAGTVASKFTLRWRRLSAGR